MKKIQTISLMVMALTLAACNEKVSPELQDANVVAPPPPVVEQESFTFRVTTTSDPSLEYLLHKTGNRFKYDPILTTDDCEVTKRVTTFSRSGFGRHQDALNFPEVPLTDAALETLNDITCYLEAEELGLYMEGLKLRVEATPGTCRYVRYSPFSYFNRKPGNSSATYKKITCDDETDNSHVTAEFALTPGDIAYSGGSATCGQYLIDSRKASDNLTNIPILPAARDVFRVDSNDETAELETEAQLCRFNYETLGEEKCDVGEITVNDIQLAYDRTEAETDAENFALVNNSLYVQFTTAADDGDAGTPDDSTVALSSDERAFIEATPEYSIEYSARLVATLAQFTTRTLARRTINCAGKVNNCVEGPIKTHPSITTPGGALISTIIPTASSYSQEYSYGTLNPTRQGTYVYANFRRELANSSLEHLLNAEDPSTDSDFAFNVYTDVFDSGVSSLFGVQAKTFEPRVIDRYTSNKIYDNSTDPNTTKIVLDATWETNSFESSQFGARPYAAEAFMGLGTFGNFSNKTNPFYSFECLDGARETTARIRIVVRDWDLKIPLDTTTTEQISDIYLGNVNASQDNTSQTLLANGYEYDSHNDFFDFDDILRFTVTFVPGIGPEQVPSFPYIDSRNFPNEDLSE